ncbi:MAG: hypothetical protein ACNI3C_05720 [Candidatus Marinarcus sp.]|uniref:hypothetical protein n=1 Tax=Candidatus Marinarcus sp. TaxID=3100987 RepID=UPI003B00D760
MTIYIYGSKSFKNSIHEVLDHANIKFRLGEGDEIRDVTSLTELMDAVEDNPKNIFLIDDEKIIRKNSLNDKIKFLKPKGGIEEEFLKEHGIGDMSVDSIEDIPSQVIKRIELMHKDDSEYGTNSLEYYEDTNRSEESTSEHDLEFAQQTQEESISVESPAEISSEDAGDFDYDDVLSFLSEDEEEKEEDIKEDKMESQPSEKIETNDEVSLEEQNSSGIENDDFGLTVEKIEQKGAEDMSDEFSELDSLSEDELLAALNGIDGEPNESTKSVSKTEKTVSNEVELNSNSVNDIASLITQLLNNKTLEITIKIKE